MSKQYVCSICGGPNTKQRAWKQKPCSECALKRSHAAVSQLHNKSGPMWEKWKRNWKAATGLTIGAEKVVEKASEAAARIGSEGGE